ncbi:MAG: HEAT repeat domain-containing protein [Isosphaeraceae bacterium]|nr:HEAT repeat domain-containing protein [Isosphaeraceae bacterium]
MRQRIQPRAARSALWWALLVVGLPGSLSAQVGPAESAKKLKPAEGLEATLWASEPLVVNPTNIDVDSRGRVWVTEGLNYRLTRGGNKKFERPPGADKIKILEDTDGDGKADKMTVFAHDIFPVPMGIAVEERYRPDGKYQGARVYVGNSPDLLVLEDTDGDDKADKRFALLTGFGGVDSDHGLHGVALGLDGKLYFTHGDGCCSVQQDHSERIQNFDVRDKSGRHVSSDQLANTLRVDRDGRNFEVLCDRQRNNYETSLNAFGNIFTSDNDDDGNRGCRVIQVFDGGHYGYRTPGSPRHWGEEVPGNVPKLVGTGNGSPCGIMVYEGDLLPKEYYGGLLEADAGSRQINFFPLTRYGSTFRTDYKVFLGSDDPWFRPVDATAAPDGSVFVADWYDAGVGGHAFRDQTTGRIYRVAPQGAKLKPKTADFASVRGLIEALKSPVVAAQDAARRSLIARAKADRDKVEPQLVNVFTQGRPVERARALWVLAAIAGDAPVLNGLKDDDPRIREQAVRMLGRDDRTNGHVDLGRSPEAGELDPPALAHLGALLPLAADPDPGVRRELILALRNVPTEKAGEALKTLARMWDGQDRWYLEALGLALEKRDKAFFESLFDGTLYGDLDLDEAGQASQVAVPPYFPADRNEAFIAAGTNDLPASPLSKTLGLMWRVHTTDVVPLLKRIMPKLGSPELQQAADDVLAQLRDPRTALVLADLANATRDPGRRRELLATLGRKLEGEWRGMGTAPAVEQTIEKALQDPETQTQGIALVAATGGARYKGSLEGLIGNARAPMEVRVAAVEAIGAIHAPEAQTLLDRLIGDTKGKSNTDPLAEAAVRTIPRLYDARHRLREIFTSRDYPPALRREALRTFARQGDGAHQVLAMARGNQIPDELKMEAASIVHNHPNRQIREEGAKVLPLPKAAGGRPLPPVFELVRRAGAGHADKGREVFFRAGPSQKGSAGTVSCGGCHRVQGQGQWVGPDLSTIGMKYGIDELFRSILNPSAAIGYNFRTVAVALRDGQTVAGIPVEESPDRLVLKTNDGKRITVRPSEIEERTYSDVSLMPEGLAESLSDDELVDLLAFLSSLRQPVSIVGQYHVIGPLVEDNGTPAIEPAQKVDLNLRRQGPSGQRLSWRRLDANAEGRADLTTLIGGDSKHVAYAYVPVVSPVEQDARLVFDTRDDLKVWLNGKALALPGAKDDAPRTVSVTLPKGPSELLIRVPGGPHAALVTTFAANRPLVFRTDETP